MKPVRITMEYSSSGKATGEADVHFDTHEDAVAAMLKDRSHVRKCCPWFLLSILTTNPFFCCSLPRSLSLGNCTLLLLLSKCKEDKILHYNEKHLSIYYSVYFYPELGGFFGFVLVFTWGKDGTEGLSCWLNSKKWLQYYFCLCNFLKMDSFMLFSDHRYIELFLNSCPKGK